MSINSFQPIQPLGNKFNESLEDASWSSSSSAFSQSSPFREDEEGKQLTFQSIFSQMVNGVNNTLLDAGDMARKAVTGDIKNLHELSIQGLKAEVMLKLATQVTSKMTQAATQLFQMQI